MALDFLSDVADIGSFAAGLASLFRKPKQPEGYQELLAASRRGQDLAEQLANPNDPRFLARVDEEEGRIRSDAARSIKDILTANRRAVARTGTGLLFNPERRDETASSMMADAFEKSRDAARTNVRSYLASALQANNIAMGGFSNAAQIGTVNDAISRGNPASGLDALFKGIKAVSNKPPAFLGSMFGATKPLDGSNNLQSSQGFSDAWGLPQSYSARV